MQDEEEFEEDERVYIESFRLRPVDVLFQFVQLAHNLFRSFAVFFDQVGDGLILHMKSKRRDDQRVLETVREIESLPEVE